MNNCYIAGLLIVLVTPLAVAAQPGGALYVGDNALLRLAPASTLTVTGGSVGFSPLSTLENQGLLLTDGDVFLNGDYYTAVASTLPGVGFGQLRTTAAITLGGTLTAELAGDFLPAGAVRLELILADSRTGTFADNYLPDSDWLLDYTSGEVYLTNENALPVTWLRFGGKEGAGGVQLNWATADEEQSDFFGVERQQQDGHWREIGRVQAAGRAVDTSTYTFLDHAPGPTDPVLYRLRQVDFDGTVDYSEIIAVRLSAGESFSLYPNPTSGTIFLTGAPPNHDYRITDVHGRTVATGSLPEGTLSHIVLPEATTPGVYFLRLADARVLRFNLMR